MSDLDALLAQLDAALAAATPEPPLPEATVEAELEAPAPIRESEQALYFTLADHAFALPARSVRAIARLHHLSRVPGVGPHIAGITTLRGGVLPLLDVALMLGLTTEEPPQQIIVVVEGLYEAGLLVNRVEALMPINALLPVLETRPANWQRFLRGEIDRQNELALLLNPGALLNEAAETL
jgi:purine-binding chemotaxis protein CheW